MKSRSRKAVARVAIVSLLVGSLETLVVSPPAFALCSSADAGRWLNVRPGDDPAQIEIYFAECGDTVQTQTRLGVKVSVRQSSGALYTRPPVTPRWVTDKTGKRWLVAKVPTGGYVDHVWMRRVRSGNQDFLKVYIRHESLDSKPSAESWHDYRRG